MNSSKYVRQHFMLYPQTPVVSTKAINLLGLEDRPTGQNCIVAVLPFEGYNIEDAVVFNKASVDRGLGRTFFNRIYEAEAKQYPAEMKDNFEIPQPDANIRGYRGEKAYRLLEQDGAIMHEAVVNGGDILIGRTSPQGPSKSIRNLRSKVHTGETLQLASGHQKTAWWTRSL